MTDKERCSNHLCSLKYALAGDLEAVDLLSQLAERLRVIEWGDPAFVKLCEEMRAPLPKLTPEEEAALQPSLSALLHVQSERLARHEESLSSCIPLAKKALENQEVSADFSQKLNALVLRLTEVHVQMRDKLEMLGVDTTEYRITETL